MGVIAAAWSLGSRGGSLREVLATGSWRAATPLSSGLPEEEEYFVALLLLWSTFFLAAIPLLPREILSSSEPESNSWASSASRRGANEDLMDEFRLSRSRARLDEGGRESPLRRYAGSADLGLGPNGGDEPATIAVGVFMGEEGEGKTETGDNRLVRGNFSIYSWSISQQIISSLK